MKRRGWIVIHEEACTGCGRCVDVCPVSGIEPTGSTNARGHPTVRFIARACRADRFCLRACPEPGAISVHRGEPLGAA